LEDKTPSSQESQTKVCEKEKAFQKDQVFVINLQKSIVPFFEIKPSTFIYFYVL